MVKEQNITISQTEYNELLSYKQAFVDMCSLKKKAGKTYENYKDMQNMDKFLTIRYGEMYKNMKLLYNEMKKF